ncbi:Gfo/Idh/MocA family oxidoreductase [Mycolicibacterium smegmatis]|uniref:Gfo/Idh/MocA family protein n=1 Tax=Mycolicibacterium smegmatis TaxID=1772 RepID=UPI0005D83F4D|nr:Gfo/Idh/MocA family oxidoreductase [Mycolicibacterium smegmatis]MDF1897360.1 Gfo/Idh/MocA family oxidoreductase [Mycolicibacterium smegmatis]MDF1904197.1 Gfo/Idh/MocA family oxidoreductase [Mycolicibacterium smegmatis]MDF1916926.1 Gfo/Idh/MocA family oxidoreductase [Mycolicibacterium smegmatis]MDF1922300.1 Gfo/Idh/MocA family oxidoreductase [Mycolicibacterium smegmatis]UAK56206.1 Gfo/Idh/MocA family oxidoreductase [Mycolicibacterium smegmatis]
MRQINLGIIGTGWCGGIRAVTASRSPLVADLHLAEINPARRAEITGLTDPTYVTEHWQELVENPGLDAIVVSATPEDLHYPMTKAALEAGKHVLLEKPVAVTLAEADELIALAESANLKFTIGYSQRFNDKQAMIKRAINDGTLGNVTSILLSRHITRSLGAKISSRTKLSPAAMEATHDLDFAFWCLEPRRPVRVYSQNAWGVRASTLGSPDTQYLVVTMDDGVVVTVGAGMSLPPGYPNASTTWMEVIGTEGAVLADASHRDIVLNTVSNGVQFPLSTMPGEFVDHVYSGPMERETTHFIEAVACDRPVLVEARLARVTMEVYLAADLSAQRNEVVHLPLSEEDILQTQAETALSRA